MSEAQDKKISDLEHQLTATQEILGAVLYVVGESVDVTFKKLDELRDIPNRQINIENHPDKFVIELVRLVEDTPVENEKTT